VTFGAGEHGIFFFQNQYRINTDSRFNDFREKGLLSNFERIQVALGYEHAFSDHWRSGIVWRHAAEDFPSSNFYGLFLRHSGAIKSLYLNKQLLTEYVTREDQQPTVRTYLLAEVGKQFQIRSHRFTPSLSLDAGIFSRFAKEETTAEERFIDRTRLRLNVTYEATPSFHITPYFMRQTDRYYVEVPPVYDENDVLVTNGYRTKRNRITPVIGIELKYQIKHTLTPASFAY